MSWFVSILVALLAGALGLVLSGFIANACVTWYQIPSREGASGFFIVFIALAGGIVGFLLSLIMARWVASAYGPSFARELGAALILVVGIAAISAGICRLLADIPPTLDGQPLNLQVEFRFPDTELVDSSPTADQEWTFVFASISNGTQRHSESGMVLTSQVRLENGRWIVPAEASLFTSRGGRLVSFSKRGSTDVNSFLLPLPAHPGSDSENWSDWIPYQQANGEAWPANKMSCRFRVQKVR